MLNHLAYRVADIERGAEHLEQQGCFALSPPNPAVAFDGALIQFFYSPMHFLIELIEQETSNHAYTWP